MFVPLFLTPLPAFDSEIDCLRYIAADAVEIRSRGQTVETYLLLIGNGDQISVGVEQFKDDLLIAMILVDLRIQQ